MITKIYIEKRKGATKHQLWLYIRTVWANTKIRTGVRIEDQFFDRKKQRVRNSHPLAAKINRVLTNMQLMAESTYWEFVGDTMKEPNNKELQEAIKIKLGRKPKDTPQENKMDFFTYVETELIPRKHDVKSKRLNIYKVVLQHLRAFEKKAEYKVDFETINMSFYNKFMAYLNELNLTKAYIYQSIIKTLVFFLNQATDDGYNTNMTYKDKRFRRRYEGKGTGIYLNEEELEILYNLDLSDKLYLERVRDMFLVGCYTGLRHSDYKNISPASVSKQGKKPILRVLTQKTNTEVFIPMHPYTKTILEKYKYNLPVISNQKMNKYLKELGEYALFDDLVEKTTVRGKKTERTIKPKYEFMTTHTARRSFATNAFLSGEMSVPEIMAITAHSKESTFLKYIRINKTQAAEKASESNFFKGRATNK